MYFGLYYKVPAVMKGAEIMRFKKQPVFISTTAEAS